MSTVIRKETTTGNSFDTEKLLSILGVLRNFIEGKLSGSVVFTFHNGNISNKFSVEIIEDLRSLDQKSE